MPSKITHTEPSHAIKEERKNKEIQYVQLNKVTLHPEVSEGLISTIASVSANIYGQNMLSEEAITCFLEFHPPHVLTENKSDFFCFAGIRSYQLAKTFLEPDASIPTIVHPPLTTKEIINLAPLDAMFCQIIFGLDKRTWEIDMLAYWQTIGKEQLARFLPGLQNKFSLAQKIGADRRRYSVKAEEPTSKLKNLVKNGPDGSSAIKAS